MIVVFLLSTWALIFLASRKTVPFSTKRYFYAAAVLTSAIALGISIMDILNNYNV
jgi:hypothetical protein